MLKYINDHGFLIGLLIAGAGRLFAGVVRKMPPLPTGAGYWSTWAYGIAQWIGANSDKIPDNLPDTFKKL
jgi:hypothetical protein